MFEQTCTLQVECVQCCGSGCCGYPRPSYLVFVGREAVRLVHVLFHFTEIRRRQVDNLTGYRKELNHRDERRVEPRFTFKRRPLPSASNRVLDLWYWKSSLPVIRNDPILVQTCLRIFQTTFVVIIVCFSL